jgi:non-homologous end joining protein Ku
LCLHQKETALAFSTAIVKERAKLFVPQQFDERVRERALAMAGEKRPADRRAGAPAVKMTNWLRTLPTVRWYPAKYN